MMANNIALLLLRVWDVSSPTVAAGQLGGVWRLTLLSSALQALGVAGVWLLPTSVRDQKERQRGDRSSWWGELWGGGYIVCVCSHMWMYMLTSNVKHTQINTGGVAFVGFVVVAFVWTVTADAYILATGNGEGEAGRN
jgi:hypothetical protein